MIAVPLKKVLATDSVANSYSKELFVRRTQPSEDGTFGGEGETYKRLWLQPYSEKAGKFKMLVTGFSRFGSEFNNRLWFGTALAEFEIETSIQCPKNIPLGKEPTRVLSQSYYFASKITLLGGSLGTGDHAGEVLSWKDKPGAILMDARGCQRFWVDFCQLDNVAMNAMWKEI